MILSSVTFQRVKKNAAKKQTSGQRFIQRDIRQVIKEENRTLLLYHKDMQASPEDVSQRVKRLGHSSNINQFMSSTPYFLRLLMVSEL
ncbi:hypothetical protein CEXT_350211 [Caerostris extrusa]|uniref:Uncharacterized protein n=1 Tax=Caerostris extrusa TaxID=172846 RepID=A0AAV4X4Z3_CAEEX|nr:hypothetical protein CEXT_350211 [Caerostris extrusa]